MEVILFYALLIGGIGAVVAAYLYLIVTPVGLIAHRLGVTASVAYAALLGAALYAFYEPPHGGLSLEFAAAGMQANLFIVGFFQDPPIGTLVAGAVVSAAGFMVVAVDWLARRRRGGQVRRPRVPDSP